MLVLLLLLLLPPRPSAEPGPPASGPAPRASAPARSRPDDVAEALRRLAGWVRHARRNAAGPGDEALRELRATLGELDRAEASVGLEPEALERSTALLIEVLALRDRAARRGAAPEDPSDPASSRAWRAASDLATRALRGRCGREPEAMGALLSQKLALPQAVSKKQLPATIALLGALRDCPLEPLLAPLVSLAGRPADGEGEEEVRRRAEEALIGWPDPRVTEYLLGRAEAGSLGVGALTRHLLDLGEPPTGRTQERLRGLVGELLVSEQWRDAARGLDLVATLDGEHAVPILIEALGLWRDRAASETGSRRILGQLVSRLRRRSGRSLGDDPAAWRRWWGLVQEGRIALPTDTPGEGELYSSAPFFGLHLETDRVVFVLDNSGSMASPLRSDGTSRYDVAIEELVKFLRASGPGTRFQVVLFSDGARMWQRGAVPATTDNVERVRRWLRSRAPGGSTMLYAGIREALDLDTRGHPREPGPEADTVVVLCDGATTEGKGWVAPWLRRENERARLVFQCVQIGHTGNGTLEALAEGSGGRCVVVE